MCTRLAAAAGERQYYLQRNPGSLNLILGKIFVFAFTWSFGGNLRRQDEPEEDVGITGRAEEAVVMTEEFDLFVRQLFDVEPPIGTEMPSLISSD